MRTEGKKRHSAVQSRADLPVIPVSWSCIPFTHAGALSTLVVHRGMKQISCTLLVLLGTRKRAHLAHSAELSQRSLGVLASTAAAAICAVPLPASVAPVRSAAAAADAAAAAAAAVVAAAAHRAAYTLSPMAAMPSALALCGLASSSATAKAAAAWDALPVPPNEGSAAL